MDIQAVKLEIIKIIADIQGERLLNSVKALLKPSVTDKPAPLPQPASPDPKVLEETPEQELLRLGKQPIPKTIDVVELARQQNYDGKRLSHRLRNIDRSIWKEEEFPELVEIINH